MGRDGEEEGGKTPFKILRMLIAKRKSRFTHENGDPRGVTCKSRQSCLFDNFIFIMSSNFTTAVIETFWDLKICLPKIVKRFGKAVNRENRFTTPVCTRCPDISHVVLPHDISSKKKIIQYYRPIYTINSLRDGDKDILKSRHGLMTPILYSH